MSTIDLIFFLFMVLVGWHLLFLLIKFIALLTLSMKNQQAEPQPVSIIVCTRNEEENLRELVPLLLEQDHPNFEVIIVLDRCMDESLDYLKALEPKHPNLRTLIVDYVPDQFHPKKFGLTLAIKGAKSDWVLLTDADCRPTSNQWASIFSKEFSEGKDFVLGYSPYMKGTGFLHHHIQYETWTTAFEYYAMAKLGMPYMGVGRNLAYRKSVFLKAKGFNDYQSITGGDDDLFVQQLATRKNTSLVFGQEALTLSKPKTTWSGYWKQKLRHLSVGKYYKRSVVFWHVLRSNVHLGLWVSFLILAISNNEPLITWLTMLSLLLIKGLFFRWSAQKLGQGYQYWITPILDFSYAFFIPVVGTTAFFRKNIKWK